jgi:hypothetical protein
LAPNPEVFVVPNPELLAVPNPEVLVVPKAFAWGAGDPKAGVEEAKAEPAGDPNPPNELEAGAGAPKPEKDVEGVVRGAPKFMEGWTDGCLPFDTPRYCRYTSVYAFTREIMIIIKYYLCSNK